MSATETNNSHKSSRYFPIFALIVGLIISLFSSGILTTGNPINSRQLGTANETEAQDLTSGTTINNNCSATLLATNPMDSNFPDISKQLESQLGAQSGKTTNNGTEFLPMNVTQSETISQSELADNPDNQLKWLHTEGKLIKASDGNVVILRGVNFMGYEFGAWESHSEEDYARLANWGFNVVRLPIAWHFIEPAPEDYQLSYFEKYVDRDIAWAKKYGIYVILEMHQYHWSNYFTYAGKKSSGVPSWAVNGYYPNNESGEYQAKIDFWVNGLAPNGTLPTPDNPSLQERLINVWKLVASRYKNEPAVFGYELFNEPGVANLRSFSSQPSSAQNITAFFTRAIDAIRAIDDKHIILYQPLGSWGTKYATQIDKTNIVFSIHFNMYKPYDGNSANLENDFVNNYYNQAMNWNIPTFVTEISIEYDAPNAGLWTNHITSILERYGLSWAWWSYWKEDAYKRGLLNSDGSERAIITQYLKR